MPGLKYLGGFVQATNRFPDQEEREQRHDNEHEALRIQVVVRLRQDGQNDGDNQTHGDAKHFGQDQALVTLNTVQHSIHPQAEHADSKTASQKPSLSVLKLMDTRADGADVPTDEE